MYYIKLYKRIIFVCVYKFIAMYFKNFIGPKKEKKGEGYKKERRMKQKDHCADTNFGSKIHLGGVQKHKTCFQREISKRVVEKDPQIAERMCELIMRPEQDI